MKSLLVVLGFIIHDNVSIKKIKPKPFKPGTYTLKLFNAPLIGVDSAHPCIDFQERAEILSNKKSPHNVPLKDTILDNDRVN